MSRLAELENRSIFILRTAYRDIQDLAMLWSIGKDSTVLLWLTKKAFFGHIPYPLLHIDTGYKIPEMITYRDALTKKWKLPMVYCQVDPELARKQSFPAGTLDRLACCRALKTIPLQQAISGAMPRYVFDHTEQKYKEQLVPKAYKGVILGIRADEEGSRSKERYFSPRCFDNFWCIEEQPLELSDMYNTFVPPGAHMRVHPLLDWTELDIWEYIAKEKIPVVDLYFDRGQGERYRSLGCYPCTKPISSSAKNLRAIVAELKTGKLARIAERSGRAQDKDDAGTLETLRRQGYM